MNKRNIASSKKMKVKLTQLIITKLLSGRPEFQTITSSRFHLSESKNESTVIV